MISPSKFRKCSHHGLPQCKCWLDPSVKLRESLQWCIVMLASHDYPLLSRCRVGHIANCLHLVEMIHQYGEVFWWFIFSHMVAGKTKARLHTHCSIHKYSHLGISTSHWSLRLLPWRPRVLLAAIVCGSCCGWFWVCKWAAPSCFYLSMPKQYQAVEPIVR